MYNKSYMFKVVFSGPYIRWNLDATMIHIIFYFILLLKKSVIIHSDLVSRVNNQVGYNLPYSYHGIPLLANVWVSVFYKKLYFPPRFYLVPYLQVSHWSFIWGMLYMIGSISTGSARFIQESAAGLSFTYTLGWLFTKHCSTEQGEHS